MSKGVHDMDIIDSSLQPLGPSKTNIQETNLGWNALKMGMVLPNNNTHGIVPHILSQFPSDSGFIERAAKFSCFNGGTFSDMLNNYDALGSTSPYSSRTDGRIMEGLQQDGLGNNVLRTPNRKSQKNDVSIPESSKDLYFPVEIGNERNSEETLVRLYVESKEGNESNESEFSDDTSILEGTKKRKRGSQVVERTQISEPTKDNIEVQQKIDQNPILTANKSIGKQSKHGSKCSDPCKEEYIHIRARRGQATNSHSLAERLRREKISERMKCLQDLVPGCSKVTGKAVLLDEIINYVQSLQRQIEFLSMKLATVNPRMDLNVEGLFRKDILQPCAGPSSVLGYCQDVSTAYNPRQTHPNGALLGGLSLMHNSSNVLGRTLSSQLTEMSGGGFRETVQVTFNVGIQCVGR